MATFGTVHLCEVIEEKGATYNNEGLNADRIRIIFFPVKQLGDVWYLVLGYAPWVPIEYCPYCGKELDKKEKEIGR